MGARYVWIPVLVVCLLVCIGPVRGQEAAPPPATWQETGRKVGLSAEDIASLDRNGILVTNEAYKQVFSAYMGGLPFFITSDSLLNAYHVLYEESIYRLENAMAGRLPGILRLIAKNIEDTDERLEGNPALVSAAKKRAMLVPGIALRLMDDSFRFGDEELDEIVTREAEKIVKAEWVGMPEWLGPADTSFTALDYSRYMPRGFYTRSERLQRYFRAVSWLQSIPFRVEKDEELLAILMLGSCLEYAALDNFAEQMDRESFFRTYTSFIGAGDDWNLMTAAQEAQGGLHMYLNGNSLQEKRSWLMKKAEDYGEGPLINDQMRFAPDDSQKIAEPNFRIISAYRTPSAILFQRTTDLRAFNRSYPNGLEVAVSLGSSFARKNLSDPQKEKLLKTIESCRPYFKGESLYFKYLDAIKALLDEPEPDAPDFMRKDAWQAKSCNTALAGWAQLRHTWALQAKQTVIFLCATIGITPGFVEPEPEFYSRMAELAAATRERLEEAGAYETNYDDVIRGLERLRGILDEGKDEASFDEKFFGLPEQDIMALYLPYSLMTLRDSEFEEDSDAYFKEKREWLDTLLADLKEGQIDKHPEVKEIIEQYTFDLEDLWRRFENVCWRLETISHKQLRHAPLNKRDAAFIDDYGETLAGIMLYGGNSYIRPRDDAPRVVDICANPIAGGYLHVGIARPRKVYVLYPWEGKSVLCAGAVLPYYEFVSPSRQTDASWKKTLDSDERPSVPKWVTPVISGGDLCKPAREEGK